MSIPQEETSPIGSRPQSPQAPDQLARSGLPVPELQGADAFNATMRRMVARISALIARIAPTAQGETSEAEQTALAPHRVQHEVGGGDEINVTGLSGVLANEQDAQPHLLVGSKHTASGLTVGNYLRATAPNTFDFQPVQDADLPATITRDTELAAAIAASEEEQVKDFLWKVRRGDYPGLSVLTWRGNNPDVDAGVNEDLIPWGGTYLFPTGPIALEVLSTSANDTAAGTGAQVVQLELLDASYNTVLQLVNMNGLTPVAVPGGPYMRVQIASVATAGSLGGNAGTITVRTAAAGPTHEQILPTDSVSRSGKYTIPAGFRASLFFGHITLRRASADSVDFGIVLHNPVTGIYTLAEEYGVTGTGTSLFHFQAGRALFTGPYDLKMRAYNPSANNNGVGGNITLLLEDLP